MIGEANRFMIGTRLGTTALLLGLGLVLASCGGAANGGGFAGYVSDHWPHWAGGMPDDVPPRPGTPGYEAFIAHSEGQPGATQSIPAAAPALAGQPAAGTTAAPVKPGVQPATAAAAPPLQDSRNSSVTGGGLY